MPNQIPKIDVIIDTSEIAEALKAGLQIVAVLGYAASGTVNTPVLIRDTQTLEDTFGKSDHSKGLYLTDTVKKAFEGGINLLTGLQVGADVVYAVRVNSAAPTLGAQTGTLDADTDAGATSIVLGAGDGAAYATGWLRFAGANPELVYGTKSTDTFALSHATQYDHLATDPLVQVTMPADSVWQTALASLAAYPTVGIVVVADPTDSATVDGYLAAHCEAMEADEKWRIGILGHKPDTDDSTSKARGVTLDSRWVTILAATPTVDGVKVHGSLLAGAFAGKLSARPRPTISMNSEILKGFDGISSLTAWTLTEQNDMLSSGVTPIVLKGSDIQVVRWVTTYLTLDTIPDDTFRDGSEYEVFRYVAQQLSTLIDAKYKQKANTATIRKSIASFIDSYLEKWTAGSDKFEQFIESYNATVVIVDPDEPRGVIETVGIKPVAPLHFHTLRLKRIVT